MLKIKIELSGGYVNIYEILSLVMVVVACAYGLIKFPHQEWIICVFFIFLVGWVIYMCSRSSASNFDLNRRRGLMALRKYCLHLLWVVPVLIGIGVVIGFILGIPFGIWKSLINGASLVVWCGLFFIIGKSLKDELNDYLKKQ